VGARWYLVIRLTLWFVALIVALFPAFLEALSLVSLNNNSFLRDTMFAIVPAAALALSAILDYICLDFRKISGTALALSVLGIIFNVLALTSGIVGFLVLPKNDLPVTAAGLWTFSILIFSALMMSLLTEIFVSRDHYRLHGQQDSGSA
jgi:hypothetical protein